MADNTTLNAGTGGDVIASDDITGVKFQRVKIVLGADGVNSGDVASGNPLPISDNAGSLTVDAPVATPVFVRLSDGAAAISTLPVSQATSPALVAGSAIIGKVGIDQTTVGTTNAVDVGTVGSTAVNAFPAGFQRVTDEPKQIFYDPFDAALETTNVWTAPTVAAPGVIAAVSAGVMTMGTGSTASGWSKLTSQSTFKLSVPAWTGFSSAIAIPDLAAINANTTRFWGSGSIPATPTVTVPITDGVGFEISSGKMYAVVYAAGVRTQIQDLSAATGNAKAPTDTAYHRYIVVVRTDRTYWYIDGLGSTQLVATSSFQQPQVQTLAATFVAVGSATNAAAANIQCSGTAVWDTGKNTTQVADGAFPWRKQTVKAGSTAAVAADLPAVVALHPSSPLPAGTAVIGALTANQAVNTAQINGVAPAMGTGVTGTGVQRVTLATDVALPTGANSIGTVNGPTLTKGTQAAVGFSVQRLNDAGRNAVTYYTVIPVLTTATDTLQSLTGTKSGATVVATTTPAVVTTGKTLRLTNFSATYVATATSGYGMVRLRFNTAGVVAIGSPVAAVLAVGAGTPATANSTGSMAMASPESIEFAAGTGIGVSVQGFAAVTATIVGYVHVMVQGYEY